MRDRFMPLFTGQKPLMVVPFILGIMACFIVYRKYAWVASFPYALFIGVGTGLSVRAMVATDIVGNLKAVIREAGDIVVGPMPSRLGNLVRVIFIITTMIYLFFTLFHKGPLSKPFRYLMTFGKYCFLAYMGISVGNAIMQISGLCTSAINRLIRTWLGL